jgi:hypothetical protein
MCTHVQNCRVFLILPASFLLLALFLPLPAEAATLSSTGDWLQTVDASNLISGAGSELTDTYLSPVITTTLDVTGCVDSSEAWWILIKRVDQNWDSDHFVLSVRRTSEGTGEGIIDGGDSFQEVTTGDSIFITGQGDRTGIAVQYQLTGISIQNPPANYSTNLEFTITTDTP